MIKPPSECPIKVSLAKFAPGQLSLINCMTSFASLSPISKMLPSVRPSSFAAEHRKSASGNAKDIMFLNDLMSNELPWNP
jgi:hypothetical protein